MPAGLKRVFGLGDLHFLTFSCYRRLPLLKSARARDIFVRELAGVRAEMRFRLIGYVVMPEHVHLLISEPPGENAVHGAAPAETARGETAAKEEKTASGRADGATLPEIRPSTAKFLAGAILRLQRVQ